MVLLFAWYQAPGVALAQPGPGGAPAAWAFGLDDQGLPVHAPPSSMLPEEDERSSILASGRFGTQVFLPVDVPGQGLHTGLPDGSVLVRVVVRSPGAMVMGLQFDRWELAEGGAVFLYDLARTRYIGAFGRDDRSPEGDMATALLPGDAVVVEYRVPAGSAMGGLRVASLTHGLRDPLAPLAGGWDARDHDPGYQSAPCHINVACPEAAGWQQEKRAVVMFLRPDGDGCTGTLINNTAQPGRPLVYLANHCFQPNTSQWVFYFNYEAPACIGDAGPTHQTLTGATFRASDYYSDFAIVELNTAPPPAYMPYYAGWDRTGATPQATTVIHHPLYDVKKITFDFDPATSYFDPEGIPLWRSYWDLGIVEAVSSGAALWDQHRRIVGHMTEGAQNCTNAATVSTGCAKFSAGWDGQNPWNRKRDWLDPANTTQVLGGYDPYAGPTVRVRPRAYLEGPYTVAEGRMGDALRAQGLLPATEPYTALGQVHVGGGGESVEAGVLAVQGDDAIVDWIVVELRATTAPYPVLATRSALLQRDGDVVDVDGVSPVAFAVPAGNYRVAVRHRNHLGVITASGVGLSATAVTVDLSSGAVPLHGGDAATKSVGGRRVLYAGDANGDEVLRYTGAGNDRDLVLMAVGGVVPTATVSGYRSEDVNMDGVVRYTGPGNDRDIILRNIGGVVPTAVRIGTLP